MTLAVNIAQGGSNNVTMRNRLINGQMMIDQRNAGASVTVATGTSVYTVDRWCAENSTNTAVITGQQSSSVAPVNQGLYYSLKLAVSTAQTSTSANVIDLVQKVEGFNVSDLAWGTANAKAITVSFWVYSSLTGTYCSTIRNVNGRSYTVEYSIPSANTWTQVSYTVPGDTTTAIVVDNGFDLGVYFDLGSGSNFNTTAGAWQTGNYRRTTNQANWIGTASATFYITGVQLEAGTTASPFEYRQYGTELALCQRYLPIIVATSNGAYYCMGYAQSATQANLFYPFKVTTRVPPTGVTVNSASSFGATTQASGGVGTSVAFTNASLDGCNFALNTSGSSYTTGYPLYLYSNNSTGIIQFTGCEL